VLVDLVDEGEIDVGVDGERDPVRFLDNQRPRRVDASRRDHQMRALDT
jgi:hypothetical protein